jgi:hypothetical protein
MIKCGHIILHAPQSPSFDQKTTVKNSYIVVLMLQTTTDASATSTFVEELL